MAKEIILYNLKESITEEDYINWCRSYKGPLLLGLSGSKSFTLLKMVGGIAGNGKEKIIPKPSDSPFKYIGILDVTSQDAWDKARETKEFKEDFFPQWFANWVADFYVLAGTELYQKENR